MTKSTYKPFTEWVTRLYSESAKDPITRARVRTAVLFLCFCMVSFFVVGAIIDGITREILVRSWEAGTPDAAAAQISQVRWIARIFHLIVIVGSSYFLMGLSFRPVVRAIDSQKRFIANVSHELRTPLTVAVTETEVALRNRDALSREEAITLLEGMLGKISRVSRIIQFLLVLSDLDGPRKGHFDRPLSLSAILEQAVRHMQHAAEEKRVTLSLSLPEGETKVIGSAIALEKMVTNLLRNALAHTPSGGIVDVTLLKGKGHLKLQVSDTGTGIPASDLPRLFEPFFRTQNAVSGGSGLGLAIVEEIARAHKAKVYAASILGKGATFSVVFRR